MSRKRLRHSALRDRRFALRIFGPSAGIEQRFLAVLQPPLGFTPAIVRAAGSDLYLLGAFAESR